MYPPVPSITPAEVEARVADGWTVLDVRTPAEWADGHIPGSTHIPMDQLLARLDEVHFPIVCVCAVGSRSARVTAYFTSRGYESVNLGGGLDAWALDGYELTVD